MKNIYSFIIIGGSAFLLILILIILIILCVKRKLCFKHRGQLPCDRKDAELEPIIKKTKARRPVQKASQLEEYEENENEKAKTELLIQSKQYKGGDQVDTTMGNAPALSSGQQVKSKQSDKQSVAGRTSVTTAPALTAKTSPGTLNPSESPPDHEPSEVVIQDAPESILSFPPELTQSKNFYCFLVVNFLYKDDNNTLTIAPEELKNIPREKDSLDQTIFNTFQLSIVVLPAKKYRFKTPTVRIERPQFTDKYTVPKLTLANALTAAVRFRLYSHRRNRREVLVGETIFALSSLQPQVAEKMVLKFEKRLSNKNLISAYEASDTSSAIDTASEAASEQSSGLPEVMLGLAYNPATGRLTIDMVKANSLYTLQGRDAESAKAPDTYIRMSLVAKTGQEIVHCKTDLQVEKSSPVIKQKFVLPLPEFQLKDVNLLVQAFQRKLFGKSQIGFVMIGLSKNLSEIARDHWGEMLEAKGELVYRLHNLEEPSR